MSLVYMLMHVIILQYALHPVDMTVFSFSGHSGHTAEIMGMVAI